MMSVIITIILIYKIIKKFRHLKEILNVLESYIIILIVY